MSELAEAQLGNDPIALFQRLVSRKRFDAGVKEPTRDVARDGGETVGPDARMVLLKGVDERGFVFYTNLGKPESEARCCANRGPRSAFTGTKSTNRSAFAAGRSASATRRPMRILRRERA